MHGTGAETFVVAMIFRENGKERREVVIRFLFINENCHANDRRYENERNKTVRYQ